jgi:hypothetical protein
MMMMMMKTTTTTTTTTTQWYGRHLPKKSQHHLHTCKHVIKKTFACGESALEMATKSSFLSPSFIF